jgi:hypothetical protein
MTWRALSISPYARETWSEMCLWTRVHSMGRSTSSGECSAPVSALKQVSRMDECAGLGWTQAPAVVVAVAAAFDFIG